ncbi:33870_t:CDS:2 [Gigaspora margarita]|uniref:33870_t:CDS:1 n=1 Tax=Gigaspora margarita TaxID=4874 RepID=A0ABN7V3C4_GIGMA|nr:33870_t:CDS:2 [Gigaspora margarita]
MSKKARVPETTSESKFPEHEGFESEGSESEDYTSFNNSHTSKGTSASQKTFTSFSKKQMFSLKHYEIFNDINKNIGSRNPKKYNEEDFDPAPLNNIIEDISALKTAANTAYRSYRNALRNGLEKVAERFIEDFKTFISKCLLKMIEEILDDEKGLVKITDLDRLTLDYDIYDAGDVLNLNNTGFKVLLKKKLDNKGRSK